MQTRRFILMLATLLAGCWPGFGRETPRLVEVAVKPGEPWRAFPTRTLEDLPESLSSSVDSDTTGYGGSIRQRAGAAGFFQVTRRNGRWWLVDPEGYLFLYRGVSSVRTIPTAGAEVALKRKYDSETGWAAGTVALLREHGFCGVGPWSDTDLLRQVSPPPVYSLQWNFMSSYGRERGGTYRKPGHTGYPRDCIFVFDPEFETFCEQHARQLASVRDDPWLLGHFSDNELPLKREALRNYLRLPPSDPGHRAATAWLEERHGPGTSVSDITAQDEQEFLAFVVERYFRIVSQAIKRHDPNHLYLGSRLHGAALRFPEVFHAAGPHVDVMSVNYYRAWTPDAARLAMWERESGKPLLITEWYAKGVDSGLGNTSGAGWLVKTQEDRGWFYQNFTLALLESRVCVGWDWFKYIDNDPDDTRVDPSNRDSNKGIVSNRYAPYGPLLTRMEQINERVYLLMDYFDGVPLPLAQKRAAGDQGD
jgi:hypothetical protein